MQMFALSVRCVCEVQYEGKIMFHVNLCRTNELEKYKACCAKRYFSANTQSIKNILQSVAHFTAVLSGKQESWVPGWATGIFFCKSPGTKCCSPEATGCR